MPFGLTNAPATFQHYISTTLSDLLDVCCVVYLDDILIYSKDRESHTKDLCKVLERLRPAGLYAKPSKCQFYQSEIEFLRYIISPEGISMDLRRIESVMDWPEPTTLREVQVFLGFCNFYRRFITNYAKTAKALTDLTKGAINGKKSGKLNDEFRDVERQAFRRLKEKFSEAPLLRHYDPRKPTKIETDASGFAVAAVISQQHEDKRWYPIAFWSRKLADAETRWGTPDQEMLAIVEAFKHWRQYVEGHESQVEVLTDHQNLQSFMKQPKLNGRQARWLIFLAPYDFVINYRTGKTNPADAPSRRPDYQGGDEPNTDLLPLLEAKIPASREVVASGSAIYSPMINSTAPHRTDEHRTAPHRTAPMNNPTAPMNTAPHRTDEHRTAPTNNSQFQGYEKPNNDLLVLLEAKTPKFRDTASSGHRKSGDPPAPVKILHIKKKIVKGALSKESVYEQDSSEGLLRRIRRLQESDPFCREKVSTPGLGESSGDEWSYTNSLLRFKTGV